MTEKTWSTLTSENNLPVWCYACGEHRPLYKRLNSHLWMCEECKHEYRIPRKGSGAGKGQYLRKRKNA